MRKTFFYFFNPIWTYQTGSYQYKHDKKLSESTPFGENLVIRPERVNSLNTSVALDNSKFERERSETFPPNNSNLGRKEQDWRTPDHYHRDGLMITTPQSAIGLYLFIFSDIFEY